MTLERGSLKRLSDEDRLAARFMEGSGKAEVGGRRSEKRDERDGMDTMDTMDTMDAVELRGCLERRDGARSWK